MSIRLPAALIVAMILSPAAALAQAPQTIPEADPCVDGRTEDGGRPCETLSEKLDSTGGVIRPPTGIDPDITAPAPHPNPGTTPVIPPGAVPPQQSGDIDPAPAVPH